MIRDKFRPGSLADNAFHSDLTKRASEAGKDSILVTVESEENTLLFSSLKAFGE